MQGICNLIQCQMQIAYHFHVIKMAVIREQPTLSRQLDEYFVIKIQT